ncbi:MAG TPA: hypothetical protein VH601_24660 [Bryobacteraceae bacterium]|jgi:hypothetical protein
MPLYRIHRIKDAPREAFRWAAHTGGIAIIKPKDYDFTGEVEAATPYAAWKALTSEDRPLRPGDVLESFDAVGGPFEIRIAKYIGFEPAQWWTPEQKHGLDTSTSVASEPAASNQDAQR